jgi:hypothetical protein
MLQLGVIFLYDAFAHSLTADAAQVLIGSVCLACCFLAVFFLVRESLEAGFWRRNLSAAFMRGESQGDTFLPECAGDAVRARQ